ncbi:MAG: hypothetical protein IJS01_15595 [Lentisphaeria bacterium]|nr:hypothetical protein [Lentisphaeria bacterium]
MHEAMKKLAESRHEGQFRKARPGETLVPYIRHPETVAQTLLAWGEPEESPAVAMAWGHDLLEDTETTFDELVTASDETVAAGILLLTRKKRTARRRYLDRIARSGNREALLVKTADRIGNARDFIHLAGPLRAFGYPHEADCILAAVENLPQDAVLRRAAAAWRELDAFLSRA